LKRNYFNAEIKKIRAVIHTSKSVLGYGENCIGNKENEQKEKRIKKIRKIILV
jgi:hypothetical protein